MDRLTKVKFSDDRSSNERPIALEFIPISIDLKDTYAEFHQLVYDYMGRVGSPPIREVNLLLLEWLTSSAALFPKSSDWETLAHILDLVTFLSELYNKSKQLEWYEEQGKEAFEYVNEHPELKEVSHED